MSKNFPRGGPTDILIRPAPRRCPLPTLEELSAQAAPCFSCGTCSAACPWGLVRPEGSPPLRRLIRRVQLGQSIEGEELWRCSGCQQCDSQCPRGVPISSLMRGLRELAWERQDLPHGISNVAWSVHFSGNPLQRPPSERMLWAKDLSLPAFDKNSEVLFYVGCTASYDRRIQKVTRALIKVFEAADVRYGVLGDREPCCGESLISLGQKSYADSLIASNEKFFDEVGARTIVALSPHCFDTFKRFYPSAQTGRTFLHYTQFLAQLIKSGRLNLAQNKMPVSVTYQDPCLLGRGSGAYEEPRNVLRAIKGLELVEMRDQGSSALCCGGGGGRMWMETPASERFSNLRIKQAMVTEAQILATACPFCVACLEDSAKQAQASIEVMDVAEIAAAALDPNAWPSHHQVLSARDEEEMEGLYLKDQSGG